MKGYYRDFADVVDRVRRTEGCCLLIGAGVSASAHIPLAGEIVEYIEKNHKLAYKRAEKKDYPHCMALLPPADKKKLIESYVKNAGVNWAHLAIAQLMAAGFVDRVLTTNFDPLIVKACALVNEFPAVYDFAASKEFDPEHVADKAIFHLHGQHSGFVMLHSKTEFDDHYKHIEPVFWDAGRGRTWIVVGYSGDYDPVFEQLAAVRRFDNELYWIGYEDNEPSEHLKENLLVSGKYAYYVKGFDADRFFVKLAGELGCFPPVFVDKPFTHLGNVLKPILPFKLNEGESDIMGEPRRLISAASEKYEESDREKAAAGKKNVVMDKPVNEKEMSSLIMKVNKLFMAGNDDGVINLWPDPEQSPPEEIRDLIATSYYNKGVDLSEIADNKSGKQADKYYKLAIDKFEGALKIKPALHSALESWGDSLLGLSYNMSGAARTKVLNEAREKCTQAEKIVPGTAAYNLACIAALQDNEQECNKWLGKAVALDEDIECSDLKRDDDFDSMRSKPWFKELLKKLCS